MDNDVSLDPSAQSEQTRGYSNAQSSFAQRRRRLRAPPSARCRTAGDNVRVRRRSTSRPTCCAPSWPFASSGSFTKAAHLFNLTQPAVSAHMRRLESIIGADLIVKKPLRRHADRMRHGGAAARAAHAVGQRPDRRQRRPAAQPAGDPASGSPTCLPRPSSAQIMSACRAQGRQRAPAGPLRPFLRPAAQRRLRLSRSRPDHGRQGRDEERR